MNSNQLKKEIRSYQDKKAALFLSGFFKTKKGEYAFGDIFLGIKVPILRTIAKKYSDFKLKDLVSLIKSKYHEERFVALILIVNRVKKSKDPTVIKECYEFFITHLDYINNWDLVDVSVLHVIGRYLYENKRKKVILYQWAKSKNLWHRRIAMLSTFYFLRQRDFGDTLKLAKLYLNDKEDLIHKASGWLLREIGKRDKEVLVKFLQQHYKQMPRTMLRYAIEKFSKRDRAQYLSGFVCDT